MKWKSGLILLCMVTFALPLEAGYRSTLNKWTRSKQWYSVKNMNANVVWDATYFSPDFRHAFAARHIEKKFLDPLEAAQYISNQEAKGEQYHEFFVGFYTRKDYRSFTLGKESFWEVVLINDKGEVIKPKSIEFVAVTAYEETMFPYLGRWSTGYRLLFPKVDLGSRFKLSLRSVLGESVMKWN